MDESFHFLTGLAISKALTGKYLISAGVIASLPDLADALLFFSLDKEWLTLPFRKFIQEFSEARKKGVYFSKIDFIIARYTHNLISCLFFSLLFWFFLPRYFLPLTLSLYSHILTDMFVHIGEYQDTLFFPFSNFHIENSKEGQKRRKIIFWIILFCALFYLEILTKL